MEKKSAIWAGAILLAALLIVGIAALASRSDSESKVAQTTTTTQLSSTEPPNTTAAPPVETTTTTTGVSAANKLAAETAEPVQRTFRSPVRCAAGGEPTAGALPSEDANNGKRWVTVQRLAGSCDATSGSFSLRGIDTRLVWRSDAKSFFAFLLDSKTGMDGTGGFADADCPGPCADQQALVNQAGTYTLRVQADEGPWEVLVQEYR